MQGTVKNQLASENEEAIALAEGTSNRSVSALDSLLGCDSSTDSDSMTNEQDAHNQAITNEVRFIYLHENNAY